MKAWRAALVALVACSGPVDIGSNGPITIDGIVAAHCLAARTAVEPAEGESPRDALVTGKALLTTQWALCPGSSAPKGLAPAFGVTSDPSGALAAQALREVTSSEYVADAPLGAVRLDASVTTAAFVLTVADGTSYFVTFAQPLRMFLAEPARPSAVVATYAGL